VKVWIDAIRAEEALATTDNSMTAMERWDDAQFNKQDAQREAQEARDTYKVALRKANDGISTANAATPKEIDCAKEANDRLNLKQKATPSRVAFNPLVITNLSTTVCGTITCPEA
jgi:hypothetical protein